MTDGRRRRRRLATDSLGCWPSIATPITQQRRRRRCSQPPTATTAATAAAAARHVQPNAFAAGHHRPTNGPPPPPGTRGRGGRRRRPTQIAGHHHTIRTRHAEANRTQSAQKRTGPGCVTTTAMRAGDARKARGKRHKSRRRPMHGTRDARAKCRCDWRVTGATRDCRDSRGRDVRDSCACVCVSSPLTIFGAHLAQPCNGREANLNLLLSDVHSTHLV